MRVLFIGGTGIISAACSRLAIERGIDLTLLTRGQRATRLPAGAKSLTVDMDDTGSAARALSAHSPATREGAPPAPLPTHSESAW